MVSSVSSSGSSAFLSSSTSSSSFFSSPPEGFIATMALTLACSFRSQETRTSLMILITASLLFVACSMNSTREAVSVGMVARVLTLASVSISSAALAISVGIAESVSATAASAPSPPPTSTKVDRVNFTSRSSYGLLIISLSPSGDDVNCTDANASGDSSFKPTALASAPALTSKNDASDFSTLIGTVSSEVVATVRRSCFASSLTFLLVVVTMASPLLASPSS